MAAVVLINLGICSCVALACYTTSSALPLWGLFFLMGFRIGGEGE